MTVHVSEHPGEHIQRNEVCGTTPAPLTAIANFFGALNIFLATWLKLIMLLELSSSVFRFKLGWKLLITSYLYIHLPHFLAFFSQLWDTVYILISDLLWKIQNYTISL